MQDNATAGLRDVLRQLSTKIQQPQEEDSIHAENQYNDFIVHTVDPEAGVSNQKPRVMLLNEQPMGIEDTFWPEKRILIPNYNRMETLDKFAMSTAEFLRKKPHDLLEYLMQPAKNDLERYRLIFRWQANKILTGRRSQPGVYTSAYQAIKDGESNSDVTPAMIFHELCSMVDLPCEIIRGYVKDASHYPGAEKKFCYSSWNIISIEGRQYICDPFQACERYDDTDWGDRRIVKTEFDEMAFLAEPDGFTNRKIPQDGDVIRQHPGSSKVSSLDEWNKLVTRGLISSTLGTKLYETEGIMTTATNVANVKFQFSREVTLNHTLTEAGSDTPYNMHVIQVAKYVNTEFVIQLPHAGKFIFSVTGQARNINKNISCKMCGLVAQYCIVARGSKKHLPFPFNETLGVRTAAVKAGFYCINYPPIIVTSHCKMVLEFSRPQESEISFQLFHERRPELKIIDMVYIEPFPNKFALHLALSYQGIYNLRLFLNYNGGDNTHTLCACFHIKNISNQRASFFADPDTWGICSQDHPVKCIDNCGSTIHATLGESSITFTSPKGRSEEFDFTLSSPGRRGTWREIEGYHTWVFAEYVDDNKQSRMVKTSFRIPRKGFFEFVLYYDGISVGRWLISCTKAYGGTLFPPREGLWGPDSTMTEQLGMECSQPARFNALNGKADFSVSVPLAFSDWHVFASLSDIEGTKLIIPTRDLVVNEDTSSLKGYKVYIVRIVLPETVSKAILTVSIGKEKYPGQTMITNSEHGYWLISATSG